MLKIIFSLYGNVVLRQSDIIKTSPLSDELWKHCVLSERNSSPRFASNVQPKQGNKTEPSTYHVNSCTFIPLRHDSSLSI